MQQGPSILLLSSLLGVDHGTRSLLGHVPHLGEKTTTIHWRPVEWLRVSPMFAHLKVQQGTKRLLLSSHLNVEHGPTMIWCHAPHLGEKTTIRYWGPVALLVEQNIKITLSHAPHLGEMTTRMYWGHAVHLSGRTIRNFQDGPDAYLMSFDLNIQHGPKFFWCPLHLNVRCSKLSILAHS